MTTERLNSTINHTAPGSNELSVTITSPCETEALYDDIRAVVKALCHGHEVTVDRRGEEETYGGVL